MKINELLLEMATIRRELTGLKGIIWIRPEPNKLKHGLRIKYCKGDSYQGDKCSTIPINDDIPEHIGNAEISVHEFARINLWISKNKNILTKFFYGTISQKDFLSKIKHI